MAGINQEANSLVYDLLIVIDATASMGNYFHGLSRSLPQIISISALTDCFQRIGVVAYRDHCIPELTEWSGWCSPSGSYKGRNMVSQHDLLSMVGKLRALGNSDTKEAVKTGLALAYSYMRDDATTIILLCNDAGPHFQQLGGRNYKREVAALNKPDAYGGTGHLFVDWVSIANTLRSGPKKGVVFSFVQQGSLSDWTPYLYLSTQTKGFSFCLSYCDGGTISQFILGTLLAWMNAGRAVEDTGFIGHAIKYRNTSGIDHMKDENDKDLLKQFLIISNQRGNKDSVNDNIDRIPITANNLPEVMNVRGPVITDFSARYVTDEKYRKLATAQLRKIISSDVVAVTVNPVFGALWRVICNDRNSEVRKELVTLFSQAVDRVKSSDEKSRMRRWLEDSYNFAADIQDIIEAIPSEERFPAVYLDPTMIFPTDEEGGKSLNEFTRSELLEIGRSCDTHILRRLGKVLTQLSYVAKREDLPGYVRETKTEQVPRIPLALSLDKHGRHFWKVLLHTVLPGTKMASRPAALLAALALRMGIDALRDVADQELMAFRERWNTLEVPEIWNLGCLSLLLDADQDYESRVKQGITIRTAPTDGLLKLEDRLLFQTLVDYKMLELNLKTTLEAIIGWTPDKSSVALGPLVLCRKCEFPRSVTVMTPNGICGLCSIAGGGKCPCMSCTPAPDHEAFVQENVKSDHNEHTQGCWVECSRQECRAQYVIYHPRDLNVPAKCFYCRHNEGRSSQGKAPVVECSKCLNRIIWPEEYRPHDFDTSIWECPACASDFATLITHETTPEELNRENGVRWMLRIQDKAIQEPLNGRSLFFTASHCDLANLFSKVSIMPDDEKRLTLSGKFLRNESAMKAALRTWVNSRRAEAGVCSLCFSEARKSDLQKSCGRSGCRQSICEDCKKSWYGTNRQGCIINVAALSCPFCRRLPATKAVNQFVAAWPSNIQTAVSEANTFIHAWCNECGLAKPYRERVCAAGATPPVTHWRCEECEQRHIAAAEERRAARNAGRRVKTSGMNECPGCGVATEKISGCDHMACPCGTDWCYGCGEVECECWESS
jgi:hypothetical protein